MNDEAVMQSLFNEPEGDTARMVLADALIERGDPRGELIAVQIALCKGPTAALKAREQELLSTHREKWFGPLERFLRARGAHEYVVRRGFVDHVRVQLHGARGEVDRLFELAPTLRSLEVNGEGLTASQSLRQLDRLCVTGVIGGLSELLSLGYFDLLSALDLQVIEGDPGDGLSRLKRLVEFRTTWAARNLAPLPKKLRVLDGYGEDLIRTQLAEPRKQLKEFGVRSATLDFETADALANQAPHLTSLMLRMSTSSPAVLQRIFRVKWPALRRLEVQGVRLTAEGVEALANLSAPKLANVELNIVHLGDNGAKAIVGSRWFSQLNRLSLIGNRLTDDALGPLFGAKHRLAMLALQRNKVTAGALENLRALPSFRNTEITAG